MRLHYLHMYECQIQTEFHSFKIHKYIRSVTQTKRLGNKNKS